MYGSRFASMWDGINLSEVKSCWSDELAIFTVGDVGKAVSDLKANNFPPTLPEFLQLCEKAKAQRESMQIRMTALPPPVPQSDELEAAKARCMETVANFKMNKKPTRDWAYKLMAQYESGGKLTPIQFNLASEAIRTDPDRRYRGAP